jgi:hypothetical protein
MERVKAHPDTVVGVDGVGIEQFEQGLRDLAQGVSGLLSRRSLAMISASRWSAIS